jgi:DNA-binding NarL/FixJ family response regulator
MKPGELQVVLADDSYLIREGTRNLLNSSGRVAVVAAVGDADALLSAVDRVRPDAVLTDIRMPPDHSTEGIRAAHAIRTSYPQIGVVVLSQHADESYVLELMKHGVAGLAYLLKERIGDLDQLLQALYETSRGGTVIDPLLLEELVGRRSSPVSSLGDLTDREHLVLREMARGKSNVAIAKALSLSPSSIEKHISSIFVKLGLTEEAHVHRRVAAVVAYLKASRDGS